MVHMRRTLIRSILMALLLFPPPVAADAAPRVVASIKPVHALVAAVMQGVGTPQLLIGGGANPHMHALRPSEARMLQQADLVFWIGGALENFLVKPLARDRAGRRAVALSQAPGVRLRAAGPPEAGGAEDKHSDDHGDAHRDMHVWLDPGNAAAMAEAIAAALALADPAGAAAYRRNAQALQRRLTALDASLRRRLAPVQRVPFIAYHDAYGYFTDRYGLNALSAIAPNPERRPGVARLRTLRRLIETQRVQCVFTEPQFEPAVVRAVIRGTDARTAVLDPLGADIPAGADAYFSLMETLAGALADCLSPAKR